LNGNQSCPMIYTVRPLQEQDIPQVSEIEREAFPPPWPATNFKRELRHNSLSHYFVVLGDDLKERGISREEECPDSAGRPAGGGLKSFLTRLFGIGPQQSITGEKVLGFAGLWFMADEAHIANIAVRNEYRRRGVGELLLIAMIQLAIERKARFITLEVRASNQAAQALYRKYGLVEAGTRRGYYMDNKEDAVIMTADKITSPAYIESLRRLTQAYATRWGINYRLSGLPLHGPAR
jgi:ribosomal-protein-alanine N-acetyltransferase